MKVVDKEKDIAYLDDYSYVINISAKKHYERVCSLLIGGGTLERCFITAEKIAKHPYYYKKLYRV